ncbi:MAG: 23S rRNA (pseudouridine(1915)-N(3))-methyltransferase RlmH [Clostridia bacterium]|nr:23S rRNA (pseudouridine(1915)-N(3))-methyltransferase RlmH [Clostridia bacterium]
MPECILCVGKCREKYWKDACAEYEKRLSRLTRLEIIEVDDLPERENASNADRERIKSREGEALLARVKPADRVIALCIDAPEMGSEQLANLLKEGDDRGLRTVFVIGGSLGLSDAVLKRADRRLSMSPMTFPHQLARVMLLEQIYRAHKINAGERYHK